MIALKRAVAGAVLAGSLGVVGLGFGSAVADAAPPSTLGPNSTWSLDRGGDDWYSHGDHRGGWHRGDWNNGPGYGQYWGGGPVPGGWNGGWEPNGGFCLGGLCV